MAPEKTLYLIDASAYVYRAFFALPPLTSPAGTPTNAVYGFTTMLLKLLRDTGARYVGAIFDRSEPTFRHEAYEKYKANRAATPPDLKAQLPLVQEVLAAFGLRSLSQSGVEADDIIATLTHRFASRGIDTVVITADKDLMQLVGPHVRLWDTMRDRWVDRAEVERKFGVPPERVADVLGLMGDSVDNVPGVPGVGEKTAQALVQRYGSIAEILTRLDEIAADKTLRGAKKLAANLAEHADLARLSRSLVELREDVDLAATLDDFAYDGPDPEMLRPLFHRLGFPSLLRGIAGKASEVSVTTQAAESPEERRRFHDAATQAARFAFACDGSRDRGTPSLRGWVGCIPGADPVVAATPEHLPKDVAALLADADVLKLTHDLKRDLLLLPEAQADAVQNAFDVMLASYLTESSATHRLEDLASDLLGHRVETFRGTPEELARGVVELPALHDELARRLREQELEPLFWDVEMPLVGVLARMERRGVKVDVGVLRHLATEVDGRLAAIEAEIYELAGGPFNIASPPQLREVLFERLGLPTKGIKRGKTGLSTDVDVLTKLAEAHPLPARILDQRGLAKLKSTYVDALPDAVDPHTGRLHTSFNQTVAATGRLSSTDPNLQNIPVRTEDGRRIRAAFVAAKGCRFVGADYSQIELRLLAHFSGDPALLEAFREDQDVHARTASEVFGVLPGEVPADLRRAAKVINFGIIYGMGPQRLARELSIPLREAQQYIEQYFTRYAGVRAYMDRTRAEARERGFVTTLLGRRRSMPELAGQDRGAQQAAERTAANTPLQGSAADLIKVAMVRIDARLRREGRQAAMVLQVHDELLLEVEEAEVDAVAALVREEMENAHRLAVPLQVDVRSGKNWAEVH